MSRATDDQIPESIEEQLTQAYLKSVLHYDPETGIFTRIKRTSNRVKVGSVAGAPHVKGYLHICVKGKQWLSHRLAFLYMTGSWPKDHVDHINRNKKDNRWENLRCVSNHENHQNMPRRIDNVSGINGVFWCNTKRRWVVNFSLKGKVLFSKSFVDKAEAAAFRKQVEKEYGYHETHGEDNE